MSTMTFTDFCEKILIALYQDGQKSDQFLPLSLLVDKYGLAVDESWLSRAMSHLRAQKRIDGREFAGAPTSVLGRITGSGMAYIENKYGSKDGVGVLLEPIVSIGPITEVVSDARETPAFLIPGNGNHIELETPALFIDSALWTGIKVRIQADLALYEDIAAKVRELDAIVEDFGLSNTQTARAKAITESLVKLVGSPEPEWEAIAVLLRSPVLQSFLGLAALAQLILKIIFGVG